MNNLVMELTEETTALAPVLTPAPTSVLAPPSPAARAALDALHERTLAFPQAPLVFEHLLHGGMYARTVRLESQTIMNGSEIAEPTILIIHGACTVTSGDVSVRLDGYNVLAGAPGRKQSFLSHGPVEMTMIYAAQAATVAEAEDAVFVETDKLMSRRAEGRNVYASSTSPVLPASPSELPSQEVA